MIPDEQHDRFTKARNDFLGTVGHQSFHTFFNSTPNWREFYRQMGGEVPTDVLTARLDQCTALVRLAGPAARSECVNILLGRSS